MARFIILLQFLAVQLVQLPASSSAETVTAIQSHVIPESHGLQSVSATFYDVISLLKCSKMCMVRSFSSCKSYSYNQGTRLCKISNDVTSQSTAIVGDHTHSIREYMVDGQAYRVKSESACRLQSLKPTTLGGSLRDCIALFASSADGNGEFSYYGQDAACYPVVPMLPSGFLCDLTQFGRGLMPVFLESGTSESFGPPLRLDVTGPFDCQSLYQTNTRMEYAFDEILASHFLSEMDSPDPWLSGDIGAVRVIAGAKYYARTNCCTVTIENVHFLVAMIESELHNNYDDSICSVYPGLPDYPAIQPTDVLWLPCPLRSA